MAQATAHTDESACARLPAAEAPDATPNIAQARTADAGAPQKRTKAPQIARRRSERVLGRILIRSSSTPTMAQSTTRCPPETATR